MLQIENLSKYYGKNAARVCALDSVSASIGAGELVAIRGPSGCGKSTLLLAAGGLLYPDAGRVTLDDRDVYSLSPEQRAELRAKHLGFVFQQFHLLPYLSVEDNILAPSLAAGGDRSSELKARCAELVDEFQLGHRRRHVPSELSTGEKQRTAMARAVLRNPRLILADEPTGNLDHENATVVLEHLKSFVERGGAVLLVTHDPHAASFATRTIELIDGRLAGAA